MDIEEIRSSHVFSSSALKYILWHKKHIFSVINSYGLSVGDFFSEAHEILKPFINGAANRLA